MDLLVNGIIDFNWLEYTIYTIVVTQITIMSITLYLHRGITHSAIEIKGLLSHFFRFWLWLTTSMRTADWVAIHRKHHAKVETIDDPHSPIHHGIDKVLFCGADLYYQEKQNEQTIEQYSQNCPNDWIEKNLYSGRSNLGILLLFIFNIILFGVVGIIIWSIQMMWTPIFAAGGINGAGHYYGYRNFETQDASTNLIPLAFFIGGEELHNNHHAFPTAAKFSLKEWEFDIGWLYIKIFSFFGLIRVKRLAPKTVIDSTNKDIDAETAYAILRSKLTVLTNFTKEVMNPIFKSEEKIVNQHIKKEMKSLRTSLIKTYNIKTYKNVNERLENIFSASKTIETVYHLKDKLYTILHSRNGKKDDFLKNINEWCLDAKSKGIDCLDRFSDNLKGYKII